MNVIHILFCVIYMGLVNGLSILQGLEVDNMHFQ